jgi:hypothetical protein
VACAHLLGYSGTALVHCECESVLLSLGFVNHAVGVPLFHGSTHVAGAAW